MVWLGLCAGRRCRIERPRRTKYNCGELGGRQEWRPAVIFLLICITGLFPVQLLHFLRTRAIIPVNLGRLTPAAGITSRAGQLLRPTSTQQHSARRPAVSPPALCSLCGCERPADWRAGYKVCITNSRQPTGDWVVGICIPGQSKRK